MEERKIIESKRYNIAIISLIIILIGLSITLTNRLYDCLDCYESAKWSYESLSSLYGSDTIKDMISSLGTPAEFAIKHFFSNTCSRHHFNENTPPLIIGFFIGIIFYLAMRRYSLTVTDKRIYGNTLFGNGVELPIEHIYMVTTIPILRGVVITTTLKKKKVFLLIKNMDEVYGELNNLIMNRIKESKQPTEESK